MDEKTNLWNKKVDDLTVRDTVVITVATPIVMLGSIVIAGMVGNVGAAIFKKFRKVNETTPTEAN